MAKFYYMIDQVKHLVDEEAKKEEIIERMKNCANCDHASVCATVQERKRTRADNYTPCRNWKLKDDKFEEELPY